MPPGWLAAAAAGDVAVFVLFAALGRSQHHEASGLVAALETAWPFAAAWLLAAPLSGAFARAAFHSPAVAARAVPGFWLPAWLVALLLRAALQRRDIPISFDLVALLTNLVLLAGWRAGLSALLGRRSKQ